MIEAFLSEDGIKLNDGDPVVSTRVYEGGIAVIKLSGDFYMDGVFLFEDKWKEAIDYSPFVVAIECSTVSYIDSAAIGAMVKALKLAREKGIELVCIDMSKSMDSVFKTAKIDPFFKKMNASEFIEEFF